MSAARGNKYPTTPDGRYFVVRGRLWRTSNPELAPDIREHLVKELMAARRAVAAARAKTDLEAEAAAHAAVDRAKLALGERGPVWWDDGAPDFNRHMRATRPMPTGLRHWLADCGGRTIARLSPTATSAAAQGRIPRPIYVLPGGQFDRPMR